MPYVLGADPGAWNIIGWMLVLAVIGAAFLWVVTTMLLRLGGTDTSAPTKENEE